MTSLTSAIAAFFHALTAYFSTAAIRERRYLRGHLASLRSRIISAASAGNANVLAQLQDDYTDAKRDYEALLHASGVEGAKRVCDQDAGG